MKYNLEICKIEALKYTKRSEFKKYSQVLYNFSRKNGWLDEVCSHMVFNKKLPSGYWTFEKCKTEALKYNSRSEFKKKSFVAYNKSRKNGWLEEITNHIIIRFSKFKKCIYIASFIDGFIYIGKTCDFDRRCLEHLTGNSIYSKKVNYSSVYKHIQESKTLPKFEILHSYTDSSIASELEIKEVENYKLNGYNILNKVKPGKSSETKYTMEICLEKLIICKNLKNFRKRYKTYMDAAYINGWMPHMTNSIGIKQRSPKGTWDNIERCKEESLKYKTLSEFRKKSPGAHSSCMKNNWIDMLNLSKYTPYWNYDNCKEESLKYKNKSQFKCGASGAYHSAYINGWINEFFKNK